MNSKILLAMMFLLGMMLMPSMAFAAISSVTLSYDSTDSTTGSGKSITVTTTALSETL